MKTQFLPIFFIEPLLENSFSQETRIVEAADKHLYEPSKMILECCAQRIDPSRLSSLIPAEFQY